MAKDNFVGAWRLVASEFRPSGGGAAFSEAEGATGLLVYSNREHVSVQIMFPNRPNFHSDDFLNGTPEEVKAAFNGYSAYFGTYEVNEEGGTVTHRIKGSHFPNWVGQDQKRFFEFSGNRLTLKTPTDTRSWHDSHGRIGVGAGGVGGAPSSRKGHLTRAPGGRDAERSA